MFNIEDNENKLEKNDIAPVRAKKSLQENKNLRIALIISAVTLILVLIPILFDAFKEKEDIPTNVPDTGITLDGTYSVNASSGAFVGSSSYKFDGNKVTNTYFADGKQNTIEYTYVIAIENDVQVIKLTSVNEEGKEETLTCEFSYNNVWYDGTKFIEINGQYYFLVDENAE